VTLREIQVSVPTDARGINAAVDEAAKARADELRTRVTTVRNGLRALLTLLSQPRATRVATSPTPAAVADDDAAPAAASRKSTTKRRKAASRGSGKQ